MRRVSLHRAACLAAMICLLSVGEFCKAASVSLTPVADAFVFSANPQRNYGGAGALAVSAGGLAKGELRTVLRFDMSAAQANFDTAIGAGQWLIENITLQLTAAAPNNPMFNSSAAGLLGLQWMQNDAWTEGSGTPNGISGDGITYETLPSFLGPDDQSLGVFAFDGRTNGAIVLNLASSAGLTADVHAGALASIQLSPEDPLVSGVFNSRSFGQVLNRPVLTITAILVPEPASLLPMISALLLMIRRRGVN